MRLRRWLGAMTVLLLAPRVGAAETERLDLDACISIALQASGSIEEAAGQADEFLARLAEVEASYGVKLSMTAFLAPTFRVTGGALDREVTRDYLSWGPYVHLEGTAVKPLHTFGRVEAGARAAEERWEVERAHLARTRQLVAMEVARYYWLHVYAASLLPSLRSAGRTLTEARAKAEELYEAGDGRVTTVDRMRLRHAAAELEKYRVEAEQGAALALAALKHTMGRAESEELTVAHAVLPPPLGVPVPGLPELVRVAMEQRPELAQVAHGRRAVVSLAEAEALANWPIVFVAGQLRADWSPVREDATNPYHYDPWNGLEGGVALGLRLELDPARVSAREQAAAARSRQLEGLATLAATGIPLEVRRARDELLLARQKYELSVESEAAARKWMVFAGAAWLAGTGEPRELLEGLAAHLQARKGGYDALLAVHLSRASLDLAIGRREVGRE